MMFFVTRKNKFFHAPSKDSILIYSDVTNLYSIQSYESYRFEFHNSELDTYPFRCYLPMEGQIPFLHPYDYRFLKIEYSHKESKNTKRIKTSDDIKIVSYYDPRLWKYEKKRKINLLPLIGEEKQRITDLYNKNYLNYQNKIPVCCKGVCFWIDSSYLKEETLWKRIQKSLS